VQVNLISDIPGLASHTDPNLINPWGVAFMGPGPFWVANNNSGFATAYDGAGNPFPAGSPIVVTIPPPKATPTAAATPTGIVANTGNDFVVTSGGHSAPAQFIFATEDGTISAWNQTVNANAAILEVDNPNTASGSVYKGLALGSNAGGNFLFATNFRLGTIDVFDRTFARVTLAGHFSDPDPNLKGFAPFGIQNIGGQLLVSFAKQDPARQNHDDLGGAGNGFIDVFDTNGNFVKRLVTQGNLDSPWGMVLAPAGFGELSGDLLVGNFKDGHINAYDPGSGVFRGQLTDAAGRPVVNNGLWNLTFGNGGSAGDPHTLFFSAGIQGEAHGLFGSLQVNTQVTPPAPVPPPASSLTPNQKFVAQLYLTMLARPADPAGLNFWSSVLDSGRANRSQLALVIDASLEHRVDEVEGLYFRLLGRPADPSGLTTYVLFLQSGHAVVEVEAILASSAEYFQNHGGGSNGGFLNGLFQDTLGRPIDAASQASLSQSLAGGSSRHDVAAFVLGTTEFQQDTVQAFYQQFLKRAAEAAGLAHFTASLAAQGGFDDTVIAAIASSDEINERAQNA
jgi:uncharacterized protein (TIGR03118 family)